MAVRRSPLLKQSCVVTLSGENARKACKKQKGVPGETAAVRDRGGAGNPARRLGLATDGEMPIGAAAPMSRAPQSLAAQAAWNSRAS